MIQVRRARSGDLDFICQLTLDTLDQGISELRDIPNERVRELAAENVAGYGDMMRRRRDYAFIVAHQQEDLAGFLILEFRYIEETTGEVQTLIYNMAVAPAYLGKRVDRLLVAEAARITHKRGCKYMTARITGSNERALLAALRQGFEIERYQITMACGPEGPLPMPGRPPGQRGHATSRLMRQRQRRKVASNHEPRN